MTDTTPADQPRIPPETLLSRLDSMSIPYTLYYHEAVFTAHEARQMKVEIPGVHIKNLFLRDKKERMALVVVPHEINLDLKALAPAIGMDRISFGSPERLWTYLGVRPGSVCPFAAMNDTEGRVAVYIHRAAAQADLINAHPMVNTMSVALKGADMLRFLESVGHAPTLLDLNDYAAVQAA